MPQEVATTDSRAIRWSAPSLSTNAQATLDRARDDQFADLPVVGPGIAAELRRALPILDAGMIPAEPDWIGRSVAALATVYPPRQESAGEARTRLGLYKRMLSDVPPDILGEALTAAGKRLKFMPTPAEIRVEARSALMKRARTRRVCSALILKHDKEWKPEKPPKRWTEDDIAEANQGFRAMGLRTRYRLTDVAEGENCEDYQMTDDELVAEREKEPEAA